MSGRHPPETPRRPATEQRHGETYEDPYRWLEGDDEAVAEWVASQNEYTDAVLDGETRERLRERFEPFAERPEYHPPARTGDRFVQRIERTDDDQPRLVVRETPTADPRTLVDPNALDGVYSLDWFEPSTDGEYVVYGLAEGGTEEYDLVVRAVESGEVVERVADVGRCGGQAVAWADDGFYHMATRPADGGGHLEKTLEFHPLGGERRTVAPLSAERWPTVLATPDGVVVALTELGAGTELCLLEDGLETVTQFDAVAAPAVGGGRLYVRTTDGAPRGRVLAAPVAALGATAGRDAFETVLPESEDVLLDVAATDDALVISALSGGRPDVRVHDPEGTRRATGLLPEGTAVSRDSLSARDGACFLRYEGFGRPPAVARVGTGEGTFVTTEEPPLPETADSGVDLDVSLEYVASTDGADVPVWVVHRADVDPEAAPTVLYGYGGFRIPVLPRFDPFRLSFLRDGGVWAAACLRGGFEFGEVWHEAGMRARKRRTFDDAIAVAEHLASEYSSPEDLAIWGGSNGGLTVGAAITRRPDLFAAAVAEVPLFDMLRFHEFLLGAAWTGEFGDPDDPDAHGWLADYSPYHNAAPAEYPATLFRTAEGDTRVHPTHARKATGLLQYLTTGEAPICLRTETEAGHGVGKPTSLVLRQRLDEWGFVYDRLGMDV